MARKKTVKKNAKNPFKGGADFGLLLELLALQGVSGSEKSVREFILKKIRPHVDSVRVGRLGSLVATQKGKKPKIMLAAHMDEVGLIAESIGPNGCIRVSGLGSVSAQSLVGQRVAVQSSSTPVPGVISTAIISNYADSDDSKLELKDVFVDTGLSQKELSRKGVRVGSSICFVMDPVLFADKKMVFGKALDDRIGCFVLIELARRLRKTPNEIDFVFTVQEEVGLYGSRTSAFSINPDIGIAVDVTNSNDVKDGNSTKCVGKGPVVIVKDSDMIASKPVNDVLVELARRKKIPLQLAVSESGTTDALSISLSREGVPSTAVGVAVRNMHTAFGIASLQDVNGLLVLLEELLKKPHAALVR